MNKYDNNHSLSKALTMFALSAMSVAISNATLAQDNEDNQAKKEIEEVVVTGSNIRGAPPVGSTLIKISPDQEITAGISGVSQLLLKSPQVTNLGISENQRQAGGAGNAGFLSAINLRGIGHAATLTLMDGQRIVNMGTGAFATDPSAIPMNMIERIDIVADGASAIYGSDAVSGVVNLILRRGYEGVKADYKFGSGDGYLERKAGLLVGHAWDSGQFTVGAESSYRDNLNGTERDFFTDDQVAQSGNNFLRDTCFPGNLVVNGVNYALPAGGLTQANASSLVPGSEQQCDTNATQDLIPSVERFSLGFTFDQKVSDGVELFAEGFYWDREAVHLSPVAQTTVTIPSTSPIFVAPPDQPDATSATLKYAFNTIPQNDTRSKTESYNVVYGAKIALPADYQLTLSGTLGNSKDTALSDKGLTPGPAISMAVANGSFNPFSANPVIDRSLYSGLFDVRYEKDLKTYNAKVDGSLFEIAGGSVGIAAGIQKQVIDFFGYTDRGRGATTDGASRDVDSMFAEVLVPLVSEANSMSGIESLTVNMAVRRDKYSGDIAPATTNPKFGVTYEPIAGLSLRASYGESFRAPTLQEVRGTSNTLYLVPVLNPAGGPPLKNAAFTGPNPDLGPETAKTMSYGFDWTPESIDGLSVSVNYFDIEYKGVVSFLLQKIDQLVNYDELYAITGAVIKNPDPSIYDSLSCYGGPCVPRALFGMTSTLDDVAVFTDARAYNLGVLNMQGFDYQINYAFDAMGGRVGLGASGAINTKYETALTATAPRVDDLNNIYNPIKVRSRLSATFMRDNYDAGLWVNYVGSHTNTLSQPDHTTIGAYTTVDAHFGYRFGEEGGTGLMDNLNVSLDVSNVFDQDPPYAQLPISVPPGNGGGGFDPTASNPLGRVISMSVSKAF